MTKGMNETMNKCNVDSDDSGLVYSRLAVKAVKQAREKLYINPVRSNVQQLSVGKQIGEILLSIAKL